MDDGRLEAAKKVTNLPRVGSCKKKKRKVKPFRGKKVNHTCGLVNDGATKCALKTKNEILKISGQASGDISPLFRRKKTQITREKSAA